MSAPVAVTDQRGPERAFGPSRLCFVDFAGWHKPQSKLRAGPLVAQVNDFDRFLSRGTGEETRGYERDLSGDSLVCAHRIFTNPTARIAPLGSFGLAHNSQN